MSRLLFRAYDRESKITPTNPAFSRIRGGFDYYSPSIGTIRFGLKNSSTSWIPRIS